MSPDSVSRHQALYRRLLAVTPESHRSRHGEEQIVLFGDLLSNGESPVRLWARALPDLITVIRQTGAALIDSCARLALGVFSLGPIGLGLFLAWVSIDEYGDVPILFPITAMALFIQGAFTLLWLSPHAKRWRDPANSVFVAGELAALLVGAIVAFGSDLVPGPMIAGMVIAGQAGLGLVVAAR